MVKIIAEIGINHQGDIDIARELIRVSKWCGADYVKFQKRDLASHHYADDYLQHRKNLEFGKTEYSAIDDECLKQGIPWFASCWDIPSVKFVEDFDVPILKIPSAKIVDADLLTRCASSKIKQVMFSTGMSTFLEITEAYARLAYKNLVIMHCNSSYPAKHEELNLRCIPHYRDIFKWADVGYSGHEKDLAPTIASVALGANWIERHITLDHSMQGTDHAASIEPSGFRKLVSDIRSVSDSLGDGKKIVYESEYKAMRKLRYEVFDAR